MMKVLRIGTALTLLTVLVGGVPGETGAETADDYDAIPWWNCTGDPLDPVCTLGIFCLPTCFTGFCCYVFPEE